MRKLNAKGPKTEIILWTMEQEKPVKSYEGSGLEVGSVDSDTFLAYKGQRPTHRTKSR